MGAVDTPHALQSLDRPRQTQFSSPLLIAASSSSKGPQAFPKRPLCDGYVPWRHCWNPRLKLVALWLGGVPHGRAIETRLSLQGANPSSTSPAFDASCGRDVF